jgi:hypothetical protein
MMAGKLFANAEYCLHQYFTVEEILLYYGMRYAVTYYFFKYINILVRSGDTIKNFYPVSI